MLKSLGCEIDVVGSGALAVEAVQRKPYDLIFMDCHMPDMDGFVATKKIREMETKKEMFPNHPNSIIIALTANTLKGTKERCIEVGMDDYLTKPINYSKLQETLFKHLPEIGKPH
jgi:CheY-like chemotaxis protein